METDKTPESRPKAERECGECVTKEASPATSAAQACPAAPTSVQGFRPRWLGAFLGRLVLRVCPENRPEEPCDGCHLRALCKCAQDDFLAAARIERRVWAVLAACGFGALLICLVLF